MFVFMFLTDATRTCFLSIFSSLHVLGGYAMNLSYAFYHIISRCTITFYTLNHVIGTKTMTLHPLKYPWQMCHNILCFYLVI